MNLKESLKKYYNCGTISSYKHHLRQFCTDMDLEMIMSQALRRDWNVHTACRTSLRVAVTKYVRLGNLLRRLSGWCFKCPWSSNSTDILVRDVCCVISWQIRKGNSYRRTSLSDDLALKQPVPSRMNSHLWDPIQFKRTASIHSWKWYLHSLINFH